MYLTKIEGSPSLELVYLVLEKKSRGEKVVSLAIGDPSFNTPPEIIEAAHQSMLGGNVHYVSAYGIPDVREAIKRKALRKNNIRAELESCIFLTTKFSVYASLVSVIEKASDEVLIPDPGYFYSESVILAGALPIYYQLAKDYSLDIEEIKRKTGPRTRAIIINTPSNPTGKVLGKSELSELYEFCRNKGIFIISDEAYEDLIFEKSHSSAGSLEQFPEIVISLFSLSKSYSMTGWRSGYMVAPPRIVKLVNKFVEHTLSCLPPFIEAASAFALNNCEKRIIEFKQAYKERRDLLLERLKDIPRLEIEEVEGAFYAFPAYKKSLGSLDLVKDLLETENVAVLPGISFGPSGEGHVRLSFSGSTEDIEEATKRMKTFFS